MEQNWKDKLQAIKLPGSALDSADRIMIMKIKELGAECMKVSALRREILTKTINILTDAFDNRGVDGWMSVRSTIEALTDKTEVDKLINSVPAGSRFHNDSVAVAELVQTLRYWVNEYFFDLKDSLVTAYNILEEEERYYASFIRDNGT